MARSTLTQYFGRLSPAQAAAGMRAAQSNARRLAADARLLLEARRFPSASSIAILSIEESGKTSILRAIACEMEPKALKSHWKKYRSHKAKNRAWILPDLVTQGARSLDDLKPLMDETSAHPAILDSLKQIAFYTDCVGRIHWSEPTHVIDEATATSLVETAELFAGEASTSDHEMEIWVKIMRLADWTDLAKGKAALMKWVSAMIEAGLMSESDRKNWEDFLQQSQGE